MPFFHFLTDFELFLFQLILQMSWVFFVHLQLLTPSCMFTKLEDLAELWAAILYEVEIEIDYPKFWTTINGLHDFLVLFWYYGRFKISEKF